MHAVASPGSGYYKDVVSTDVKQADRKNCSPKSAFDFRLSRDHSHQLQQQLDASCLIKDQAVASWDYFKSAAGYSSRDDRVDEVDSIQRRRDSVDLYPITNIRSSARHFEHTDERQRSVLRTPNRSHQRRDDDNMVTESREFQHGCNDDVTTRRRTNSKHRYDTDVDLTPSSAPSTYREDSSSESVDVISASVEDTPKPGVAHKYQPEKIHSSSGGLKHLDALFQRYDLFSADKTADADLVNATETEMKQSSPVSRNREASTSSSVLTVIDDNSTSDSTPNKHLTKSSPERGVLRQVDCLGPSNVMRTSGSLDSELQREDQVMSDQQTPNRTYSLMYKKPKKCKYCEFASASKEMLWSHLRVHVPAEKLFHCSVCPFVTELKHHWDTHCRNHEKQKPFKCSMCSYMAVNQSMINSHLKTHSSARPYVCRYPSCNFKCKFSTQLRSHCEKKHGEQTSRNRKSSVRRSRGYVQNSVVDQVMTTTNSSLDTVSPVSGKAVSVSPSGDSSLLHDAATNWAMAAAAAASVWSPHLAAASSLFGGLPFVPGQTTSPLHNESLMAKGPLISSPFHQHSGYKTTVNSSPAQVVPFGQFSPLTAKIGAMQFGSPVAAARALNLQHTTANVSGRNREPAALPILHDVMPESCPRNDQRSPSHRVDDHCVLASASASAAHPGPSHSSSFKKEIRSSSTHSDSASCQIPRPTQLSTSENCDVAPLDLTKKPSVVCRESRRICEDRKSPTSITKTNLIVSEITSDSQFRKPSRRKGIAHKLDVVSANLYAVEDDVVEVETVKHLASSTAAGTKMAAEVNLSLDLSKTRSELSVSSFAADSRENKGRDHADVTADQNGSPTSRVRRVLVETGGNHGNDARSTVGKDCPYCDCVFHYSVMHAIHMEFHGPPEDPWKCNKCGIRCVDRVDFNDHIATVAHH